MKLVAAEVCHLQRSFKVADTFYAYGPITITAATTSEKVEEERERVELRGVLVCKYISLKIQRLHI